MADTLNKSDHINVQIWGEVGVGCREKERQGGQEGVSKLARKAARGMQDKKREINGITTITITVLVLSRC